MGYREMWFSRVTKVAAQISIYEGQVKVIFGAFRTSTAMETPRHSREGPPPAVE